MSWVLPIRLPNHLEAAVEVVVIDAPRDPVAQAQGHEAGGPGLSVKRVGVYGADATHGDIAAPDIVNSVDEVMGVSAEVPPPYLPIAEAISQHDRPAPADPKRRLMDHGRHGLRRRSEGNLLLEP